MMKKSSTKKTPNKGEEKVHDERTQVRENEESSKESRWLREWLKEQLNGDNQILEPPKS
jgi:hypothetical protein